MSSFFTLPTSQRKRKREAPSTTRTSAPRKQPKTTTRKPQKQQEDEDEVVSDAESISSGSSKADGSAASTNASSDHADETAAERRLRLAEQYLSNIRDEVGADRPVGEYEFDAGEVDRELIAARLKEDVAEEKGKLHRFIASRLELGSAKSHFFKADTLATTAVAMCGKYVYTASKDTRLIKWEIPESASSKLTSGTNASMHGSKQNSPARTKPKLIRYTRGNYREHKNAEYNHHTAAILCLAISHDGAFLASGGADRKLIVWNTATLKPLKTFTQHRDAVTSLVFRGKTGQLFSGSKDRTVKIWSCTGSGEAAQVAYVDTLFGHQDEVVDVAAVGGTQERCVSVGARDRTARLWKVVEESQLVFRGGGAPPGSNNKAQPNSAQSKGQRHAPTTDSANAETSTNQEKDDNSNPTFNETSLDRVTQIDTQLFVTGSDSGALSLYSLHKKKALHVYPLAHGFDPPPADFESSADVSIPALDHEGLVPDDSRQYKRLDSNGGEDPREEANDQVGDEAAADEPTDNAAVSAAALPQSTSPNTKPHHPTHKLPTPLRAPLSNTSNAPPTPRWITALKAIPYTDLFVSGSWDGYVRVWRVGQESDVARNRMGGEEGKNERAQTGNQGQGQGQGRWRIFPVGVLGVLDSSQAQPQTQSHPRPHPHPKTHPHPLKAIINDLSISALGPRGEDGVRIVAALGKEMRMGRWKSQIALESVKESTLGKEMERGRGPGNGAVVWDVPLRRP